MTLCGMINDLEDMVVEAFESRSEGDKTYDKLSSALMLLKNRFNDLGEEGCITSNIFTLEDAIHSGATISEIFYGSNVDGEDADDSDRQCLCSMRSDAAKEHEFQHGPV